MVLDIDELGKESSLPKFSLDKFSISRLFVRFVDKSPRRQTFFGHSRWTGRRSQMQSC